MPELMVLMVIGMFVPGILAMFCVPPGIPGPLIKKAKISLKSPQTNSGYSSEAKMYLKDTTSPKG